MDKATRTSYYYLGYLESRKWITQHEENKSGTRWQSILDPLEVHLDIAKIFVQIFVSRGQILVHPSIHTQRKTAKLDFLYDFCVKVQKKL